MILLGNDWADQCMDELERMEEAARVDEAGIAKMRNDLMTNYGELIIIASRVIADTGDDIDSLFTNPTKFHALANEALDLKAEKDYEEKWK